MGWCTNPGEPFRGNARTAREAREKRLTLPPMECGGGALMRKRPFERASVDTDR